MTKAAYTPVFAVEPFRRQPCPKVAAARVRIKRRLRCLGLTFEPMISTHDLIKLARTVQS